MNLVSEISSSQMPKNLKWLSTFFTSWINGYANVGARTPLNVDFMDTSLILKVLQKQDMNRINLKIVTPP